MHCVEVDMEALARNVFDESVRMDGFRGRVWAEGSPGEGATFFFAIPAADKPRA